MGGAAAVTTCIPAYQAAGFIERTLDCARGQTLEAQRILVSLDVSDDATEEICRAHARDDDRVEVVAHRERLGWVGNVNFLLDAVRSELSFIYFHDDLIDPSYCEVLVEALRDRPDAGSAHCDVVLDGPSGVRLRRGTSYEGSACERLLTYFVNPDRGALLRSMVRRSSPAGRLRTSPAGAVHEMALVAAAPAVHVASPLYHRFDERTGGLAASWRKLGFDDLVKGARFNADQALVVVEELEPSPAERELLMFGLAVYMTGQLRTLEASYSAPRLTELAEVLDSPPPLRLPSTAEQLPDDLLQLCTKALRRAERRTEKAAAQLAERPGG